MQKVKELQNDLTLPTQFAEVTGINVQALVTHENLGNEGNQISEDFEKLKKDVSVDAITALQSNLSLLAMLEQYLTENLDFRYNLVSSRLEFKRRTQSAYDLLTDYKLNSIIRELEKNRIKVSSQSLRSLILSDFTPMFDPFLDYFNSLPKWDGSTDYIGQLAETVKTPYNDLWKLWLKKWLVAATGCAINDKTINHTAIVFIGKQGTGKTTWMLNLLPKGLKRYFYSGIPNLKNKDAKIRLAECFLINLDEMDSLKKSDTERLKEIITAFEVRERRPYAHYDETMPRRASFMGSVNNKQFLNDTTGNRRFLCVEIDEIQFNHSINMDNVYSQAKSLLDSGFQYYFDSAEIEVIAEHNEQFQVVSYVEEVILKWFEPIDPEIATPTHKLSATDIVEYLAEKSSITPTDANIQKVGRIMRKHNFHRVKLAGSYVYALKEKAAIPLITVS